MKKVLIALGILTTVVVACSPKASKTPAPAATPEAAALVGNVSAGGLLISSAKCTKCHKDHSAHVPMHTFNEQEKLMHAMAKKAKLSDQETADLLSYVMENAKK